MSRGDLSLVTHRISPVLYVMGLREKATKLFFILVVMCLVAFLLSRVAFKFGICDKMCVFLCCPVSGLGAGPSFLYA